MNAPWLFLKNLLFTLLVPGFVVWWVPLHWFERYPRWPVPAAWGGPQYAALALAALLIALHRVRSEGWSSTPVLGSSALGVVALVAFVLITILMFIQKKSYANQ